MKTLNKVLISGLIFGFLLGAIGATLKILWLGNPDTILILSMIIMLGSCIGLFIYNYSKIIKALIK